MATKDAKHCKCFLSSLTALLIYFVLVRARERQKTRELSDVNTNQLEKSYSQDNGQAFQGSGMSDDFIDQ